MNPNVEDIMQQQQQIVEAIPVPEEVIHFLGPAPPKAPRYRFPRLSAMVVECYGSFEKWFGRGVSVFNELHAEIESGAITNEGEIYTWLKKRPSIACLVSRAAIMRGVEQECAETLLNLAYIAGENSEIQDEMQGYEEPIPSAITRIGGSLRTDFFNKNIIDKLSVVYTLGNNKVIKVEWRGTRWDEVAAGGRTRMRRQHVYGAVPVGTMTPRRVRRMINYAQGDWSKADEVWDSENDKFRQEWIPVIGEWTVKRQ